MLDPYPISKLRRAYAYFSFAVYASLMGNASAEIAIGTVSGGGWLLDNANVPILFLHSIVYQSIALTIDGPRSVCKRLLADLCILMLTHRLLPMTTHQGLTRSFHQQGQQLRELLQARLEQGSCPIHMPHMLHEKQQQISRP